MHAWYAIAPRATSSAFTHTTHHYTPCIYGGRLHCTPLLPPSAYPSLVSRVTAHAPLVQSRIPPELQRLHRTSLGLLSWPPTSSKTSRSSPLALAEINPSFCRRFPRYHYFATSLLPLLTLLAPSHCLLPLARLLHLAYPLSPSRGIVPDIPSPLFFSSFRTHKPYLTHTHTHAHTITTHIRHWKASRPFNSVCSRNKSATARLIASSQSKSQFAAVLGI
ncbi:hypothetical protein LZ32DRAFT_404339 [Colletotrichum eremochloae]|nr:hypothetical protein LZ32DRAFT_404339 [Colletotrichum eremochloae]